MIRRFLCYIGFHVRVSGPHFGLIRMVKCPACKTTYGEMN